MRLNSIAIMVLPLAKNRKQLKISKEKMIMIYYGGLGVSFQHTEKIDLTKEQILSWEIKKLKGWMSPNLIIRFEKKYFEQPVGLIVNYNEVIKWLKKRA